MTTRDLAIFKFHEFPRLFGKTAISQVLELLHFTKSNSSTLD